MGRKLKGKTVEKFSKEDKQKKEETLKRMDETREEDNKNLRDIITKKLNLLIQERTKGLKIIDENKKQILKLEGAILFCQELLNPKEEK